MSKDPGAKELAALLEAPSVTLEGAIEALGSALEAAHGAETGGAKLPESARAPITRLHAYYRELLQRADGMETSNPGRREAFKALKRMEEGLDSLANAVGLEGEEAKQEAELGAIEMERAGSELGRAIARLS
jgi:Rad3-related DNA helicase